MLLRRLRALTEPRAHQGGRLDHPDEASAQASYITGATIAADGGRTAV
jgi:hypothetical protein